MTIALLNVSGDSLVIAAVAVVAAIAAAYTAQLRLQKQLDHDSGMRERDATRDVLDSVVSAITDAVQPMNAAGEAFRELFLTRAANLKTGTHHGVVEAENEARATVESLRDRRSGLMAASFRLHLRFSDADPIIGRLSDWRNTFDQLADDYENAVESSDFESRDRFDEAGQTAAQLGEELNLFLTAARAWSTDATA